MDTVARAGIALTVLLAVTGCGSAEPAPEATVPVIDSDFPDPDVLRVGDTYYAYATNDGNSNVQVATSTDLIRWQLLPGDALPELPTWVIPGKTWAPEVTTGADGGYLMYTTTTNFQPTLQCLAVATADAPEGPFTVVGEEMLVCPQDEGGAIDASTFDDDDGTRYLLWKNDGNCCGLDTWLYLAPLSADGLSLAGAPRRLIKQDQPWEGILVEAPTLVKRGDRYVLLYSANDYGGPDYAIGAATAASLDGPWTKVDEPVLTTDGTGGALIGPGGQDVVVTPDGDERLVFHAWNSSITRRSMHLAELTWQDGRPVVDVGS